MYNKMENMVFLKRHYEKDLKLIVQRILLKRK